MIFTHSPSGLVLPPCLLVLRLSAEDCITHSDQQGRRQSGWGTDAFIGWSLKEHLPAEPCRVFRGADGEADGSRVFEDLIVISTLNREQILQIVIDRY